jgi:hypothetical protein
MTQALRNSSGRYEGTERVYTENDLVAAVIIAEKIIGKAPTYHEMKTISRTHNLPHPKTIQARLGSWEAALDAAGLNSNKLYEKDFLVKEIERFMAEYGHVPSTNEFRYTEGFPGTKAYKRVFGSFNNALVELGYTPVAVAKKNKYSCNTLAKDGHICDSAEEAIVDNFLFDNDISHGIQPLYPRHKDLNPNGYIRADFYLTKQDVFVEYAGLVNRSYYAAKLEKKKELATLSGLQLIVVCPSDLGQLKKIFRAYLDAQHAVHP